MMKILYVISDRNIGGAGIQLLNILRHLNRREFAVTVALRSGVVCGNVCLPHISGFASLRIPVRNCLCARCANWRA